MSEFKGTKGKWVLKTSPYGQMSVRNEIDTRKICVPRVNNYDESLYNLLLISCAPEMLDMLQSCVNLLERMNPEENSKCDFKIQEIKQLIKKSTTI